MSPTSPKSPTTVIAAAVKAPDTAAAKVNVAITRITTTARVTATRGLASTETILNNPLKNNHVQSLREIHL